MPQKKGKKKKTSTAIGPASTFLLTPPGPRGTQSAPDLAFDIAITEEDHWRLAQSIIEKLTEIEKQSTCEAKRLQERGPEVTPDTKSRRKNDKKAEKKSDKKAEKKPDGKLDTQPGTKSHKKRDNKTETCLEKQPLKKAEEKKPENSPRVEPKDGQPPCPGIDCRTDNQNKAVSPQADIQHEAGQETADKVALDARPAVPIADPLNETARAAALEENDTKSPAPDILEAEAEVDSECEDRNAILGKESDELVSKPLLPRPNMNRVKERVQAILEEMENLIASMEARDEEPDADPLSYSETKLLILRKEERRFLRAILGVILRGNADEPVSLILLKAMEDKLAKFDRKMIRVSYLALDDPNDPTWSSGRLKELERLRHLELQTLRGLFADALDARKRDIVVIKEMQQEADYESDASQGQDS